ncbi:MAG: tRNA dihydrouridine synthase [Desulfobulbus sp.]|jgi:tRNA-dihydrouridine synthase B
MPMVASSLKFGSLHIGPPLFLAPMAGLTHSALRTLLAVLGGVGLLSTEMLSAARLPAENSRLSPYLLRTEVERPLSYQLLIADERHVAPALERLHRLGADAVDVNLGCPAPRVRRQGGGSMLMEQPEQVRRLVAEIRRRTSLPLSAKIRLGESLNESGLRNFCRMLEGEGLDLLTVHGRLRGEPFTRSPRWDWIGRVKGWLSIPVVANGGIDSVDAARRCLEQSGADGLMIGRAAVRTPWLFALIARDVYGLSLPEPVVRLPLLYREFADALADRFPPERRLGRLKEFTHHFARNYFFGHYLAAAVQASETLEMARERAERFFAEHDPAAVQVRTGGL